LPIFNNADQTTVTDQAGNVRCGTVDGLDRLTKVEEDPFGSLNYTTTYSYDVLDNLTQVNQGAQTRTFVYNSFSQLKSATNPESNTITYTYDDAACLTLGQGQKDAVTTPYASSFTYAAHGAVKERKLGNNTWEYSAFNPRLQPTDLRLGATYGNRHLVTDGTYNDPSGYRQQFTGQERDDESELDYFKARYHSASLGRFTSPDAPLLDQTAVSPQSWNLYQYVRNNPLLFIDPSGRKCIDVQVVEEDGTTTTGKADDGDGTGCKAAEVAETEDKKPPKEGETEDITPQKDQAEQAFLVPIHPIPSVLSPRKGRTESFLNDVTSIFGFDQNDERQSCFGDVFLGSVAKQARAVAAIGPAASFAGQAYYHNQALRHAATRGLTYPFKSSIFRGLLAKSTATARIAGRAAPLAYLDVIMLLALNEELDAALNGRCQW
jgi:RHS repeat-associated protein